MFYKKATKIDEIFIVDLTLCSKCQIVGEDFVKFYGLLRKQELYLLKNGIEGKSASYIFEKKIDFSDIVTLQGILFEAKNIRIHDFSGHCRQNCAIQFIG